jgi:flagellar basal-body rod modification protein FlgD
MSMTINGINTTQQLEESTQYQGTGNTELGKDAFMQLLVAQLQNQDPLNPQSNEEFIAQLSQFTQVEQLMGMNDRMDALYMATASMNNASMTQLLGQTVTALGDGFSYDGEGDVELHYQAETDVAGSTLTITDESGAVVWSGAAGALTDGEGSITWDGKNMDGQTVPEGSYTFEITGYGSDGEKIDIQELVVGVVDGMSYADGNPQPSIQGVEFYLEDVIRVEIPEDEPNS